MARGPLALGLALIVLPTACATSAGPRAGRIVDHEIVCRYSPAELVDPSHERPTRDEVLDQLMRVAPHVAGCTRNRVRVPLVTTKFYIAGATGRVTRVLVEPVPDEVAQCMAVEFAGVCFVPFKTETFTVTFPFKSR